MDIHPLKSPLLRGVGAMEGFERLLASMLTGYARSSLENIFAEELSVTVLESVVPGTLLHVGWKDGQVVATVASSMNVSSWANAIARSVASANEVAKIHWYSGAVHGVGVGAAGKVLFLGPNGSALETPAASAAYVQPIGYSTGSGIYFQYHRPSV